jgi:hypothetical protein
MRHPRQIAWCMSLNGVSSCMLGMSGLTEIVRVVQSPAASPLLSLLRAMIIHLQCWTIPRARYDLEFLMYGLATPAIYP